MRHGPGAPRALRALPAWHPCRSRSTNLAVTYRVFAAVSVLAALAATVRPPANCHATDAPTARVDAVLVALTDDGRLPRFSASAPRSAARVALDAPGLVLVGIDVRSKNGKLYGLSHASDLWEIDPASGRARTVATLTTAFDAGNASAFDFNPQSDRLRLIGGNSQNLRVHPDLGAAATDIAPAYARSDHHFGTRPTITAAAYTNAVADTPTTKLFDLDTALDALVLQEPPNDGILTTVGALGVDFDDASGFDILTVDGVDHAFAASRSVLHAIDLSTGRATPLGTIGDGTLRIVGLAALAPGHDAAAR